VLSTLLPRRARAGLLSLGWLLAAAGGAHAADLQVAPISVQFKAREQGQPFWLSNTGTAPLRAQIRVQRWSQADGADKLEPATDLVASPPTVEVLPGQRQLVRIVRPQPQPAPVERTYRLIVDELPSAAANAPAGLQFLLRYSVPVFIAPEVPGAPAEAASAPGPASGTVLSARWRAAAPQELEISNAGAARVRISRLMYETPQGERTELVPGLLGYVLAGQRMQFSLPPAAARLTPGGVFKARFNDDAQEQVLRLSPAS
jgi:fimbrial chaperone protein